MHWSGKIHFLVLACCVMNCCSLWQLETLCLSPPVSIYVEQIQDPFVSPLVEETSGTFFCQIKTKLEKRLLCSTGVGV